MSELPVSVADDEAARMFLQVAENVHDYAIFLMDRNGIIIKWNRAAEVMKQYSAGEALGSFFGMLYTEDDLRDGRPLRNLEVAAHEGTFQEERWRRKKDGTLFWAMIEIIALYDSPGQHLGFCKITRDLTGQKELQEQLCAERERAQITLAAIGEAVISVDVDGKVEYLNARAEQLTGWSRAEARGVALAQVFDVVDEATQHPYPNWARELASNGQLPATMAVLRARGGAQYAIEETSAPIHFPDGRVVGAVIVFRDVTQSRRLLQTVSHQASHDPLTGLVNRMEFENCLQRSLQRAKSSGKAGALFFMDLDQFKAVNDLFGHDAGDQLLVQLAKLYGGEVRERDVLARLGGDEFAMIADHCSKDEALAIATKILESTRGYQMTRGEQTLTIGVSVGAAAFDGSTQDIGHVLARADAACRRPKQRGRNQLVWDGAVKAAASLQRNDFNWANRLAEAMSAHTLTLYGQIIAPVGNAEVPPGCEILLRLDDPQQGIVMPGAFIPAAERAELMPAIDRWVVAQVLEWLDNHRDRADRIGLCAVNLSARTIADPAFLDDVTRLLSASSSAPGKLGFEIAAGAAILDLQASVALMHGLRGLGCRVAVDGVGAGAPSFAYLRQLPADFMKIDASRASAITHSLVDERMVTSMHDIAHLMGQQTIAECVEDQATADILTHMGIDFMQGRWIAAPQSLASVLAAQSPPSPA